MRPVVPNLYFLIAWPYTKRPDNPYRAPSGAITAVADGMRAPCCADREPFLYLCARAATVSWRDPTILLDLRDVSRWMGANRRPDRTRARLERIMSAVFDCPLSRAADVRRTLRIGTMEHVGERVYRVRFTSEFVEECRHGIPYSLDTATQLRNCPGTLDLYFVLLGFAHDVAMYDEFTHEFRAGERIPLPAHIGGARRALIRRLDALRHLLPETYTSIAPTGTGILVDIGEPKRTIRAGSLKYKRRADISEATRAMSPEERVRIGRAVEQVVASSNNSDKSSQWVQALRTLRQNERRTAHLLKLEDTTGPIEV